MQTSSRKLLVFLGLWGVAAGLAGGLGLLARLPSSAVPVLVAGLSIGLSIAVLRVPWLKQAVRNLSVRTILAVHVTRFVGLYFLWLHAQGRLPSEFAYRAGWGDIAVAVGALALLFLPEGRGFRWAFLAWNIFGALDLVVAVSTAGWLNITRLGSMNEIGEFPLSLVPLWLVPVLLSSHIHLVRQRICGERASPDEAALPA